MNKREEYLKQCYENYLNLCSKKEIEPKFTLEDFLKATVTIKPKIMRRERLNEETVCQGCCYPKNECICFIDNLSND